MKLLLHFSVFVILQFLFCSFQTSFWFQIFGQTPAPQLWLSVLIYWSLYHSPIMTLPLIYFVAAISSSLSSAPMSHVLLLCCLLFGALVFLKSRIYWSGPLYYLLVTGLTTLVSPLIYLMMSWLFEDRPITSFEVFHWILSPLLSMSVALPLYRFFSWMDHLILTERMGESFSETSL